MPCDVTESATAWPVAPGMPLYVTINEAAEITGVSRAKLREWAYDKGRPIPQMRPGNKVLLLRTAALPAYLEGRECL